MAKFCYFLLLLLVFLSSPSFAKAAEEKTQSSEITLSVDKYSETLSKETLGSWLKHENVFSYTPEKKLEFENTSYCPVNKIFCELTITKDKRRHFTSSPKVEIDKTAIKSYLEDLARKVNKEPIDAKFKMEEGRVVAFEKAENGITLNVDESVEKISSNLSNDQSSQSITLAFDVKKSTLEVGDVNDLGISTLIGEGTSDFKGSPKNRIFNINVAVKRFNGVLIKPGEEFSFVSILGEVDGDHGYLPELVIKKNKTEPEFGGGICQVSTTTFRAAIYSGLKITARRNHAYPVSYYNPQGMDSTVYVPYPDLKFINNTPGYILIQTKIEGTKLTFDFYGTDDGRKIEIDGPKILERQPDGAMKTTFTQHVYDKNGNEFIKDVFNSSYDSPYKYPHPGGPVLTAKPDNWSKDQWKDYQSQQKAIAEAAAKKP